MNTIIIEPETNLTQIEDQITTAAFNTCLGARIPITLYWIEGAELYGLELESKEDREMEYIPWWDVEDMVEEMINETSDLVYIGSLSYEPGRVLRKIDPVAFREATNDYADGLVEDGYIVADVNDF